MNQGRFRHCTSKDILYVTLLLSWAVRTQPYTTKFDVEHLSLIAIVGVSHNTQPSVGKKLMRNTGNTLGDL